MKKEHTITVYTENYIGLLNCIAIMFSGRKTVLKVSHSLRGEGIHRFHRNQR